MASKAYNEVQARLLKPGTLDDLNAYVQKRLPKMTKDEQRSVADDMHAVTLGRLGHPN